MAACGACASESMAGKVDPRDGVWYCDECWAAEAAAVEEAYAAEEAAVDAVNVEELTTDEVRHVDELAELFHR